MLEIDTDDGQTASGFDQVVKGDTVNIAQSGKYLNYSLSDGSKPAVVSKTTNSTNGHDASAAYRNADSQGDIIKWQCMLKVAALVYAGAGDDALDKVVNAARGFYNAPIDIEGK